MADKKRNYRSEYDKYQGTEEQKKNRAKRNAARADAVRDGRASKGDGRDVDHKKPLSKGGSNAKSNTRVVSASTNRSFARNSDGSMKKK
jgi:hypothetical protein